MTTAKNPDEIPTVTGKRRTLKVRANLEEFGQTWRLIRPNQVVANQLVAGAEGEMNIAYLSTYFAAHVHPDERAEFLKAAAEDDSLDIEDLMALMEKMSNAVYSNATPPAED